LTQNFVWMLHHCMQPQHHTFTFCTVSDNDMVGFRLLWSDKCSYNMLLFLKFYFVECDTYIAWNIYIWLMNHKNLVLKQVIKILWWTTKHESIIPKLVMFLLCLMSLMFEKFLLKFFWMMMKIVNMYINKYQTLRWRISHVTVCTWVQNANPWTEVHITGGILIYVI
jgi:hypothetical protein